MRKNSGTDIDPREAAQYRIRELRIPDPPVDAEFIAKRLTRMAQVFPSLHDENRSEKLELHLADDWERFMAEIMDRAAYGMPPHLIARLQGCGENYPGFRQAVELGRTLWVETALRSITERMEAGDMAGIRSVLEAVDPDVWSPKRRLDVSHSMDPRALSVEQLQDMVKQLEDMSGARKG